MQYRARLGRNQRLRSNKLISGLFNEGRRINIYPFLLIFTVIDTANERGPDDKCIRVMFAVSGKNVKKAVLRNLIRRRMKEAFRKHRDEILDMEIPGSRSIITALLFTGTEVPAYKETEEKIILLLHRLKQAYEKTGR